MREETRVTRRQRQVRSALLEAAGRLMSEKGFNATTMSEVAEHADVGAGTVYNYFRSKDELAVAVLEDLMHGLAVRIERVTNSFADPARVYAYGVMAVLECATQDLRWRQLLSRSEVIADAIYRKIGPFAIRDLKQATEAGRFSAKDPELVWRMSAHAIVGVSLAVISNTLQAEAIEHAAEHLLQMAGLTSSDACILVKLPRPPLGLESNI